MRTATITIDLSALAHNLNQVFSTVSHSTKVLAMVKADAYGHGIANCLPALTSADGLGVACFEEAEEIRQLGWGKTLVLIEGVFSQDEWHKALETQCQSVIHIQDQLFWALDEIPEEFSPSRTIWLKLNTGMNRLGFEPDEILLVAKQLSEAGYQLILTSHFANADSPNHPSNLQQIHIFNHTLDLLRKVVDSRIKASLCNSAGIINFSDHHYDWVRPGIMLYGSSPIQGTSANELNLQAVMSLQAKIMAVHNIDEGASVGYGSHFITNRPMRKGIVSIGYGDGYPRVLDNSAWVCVKQNDKTYKCPVIGRVAMDMIAIDLTHVPDPSFGSPVILWGNASEGAPTVDEISKAANTIGYELLCRVTQRPNRKVI